MQATIDEQGRVEIPRALRDRLRLTPGAVVDFEPVESGFTVTPVANGGNLQVGAATLLREGSLLVLGGLGPVTLDEVNQAIDAGRNERLSHITDQGIDPQ
jgi:bifunctional DNA-binding transcriptional regulator/antitoxin component of YhaV-PrlF toxin-antitoxin module